jgi:EAL domain-containing protein (putative c-di-GMP-specific phosphodiesterase class I)
MQASLPSPAKARVLLVDDEAEVTRAMHTALRKQPFQIECADSGQRALELLAQHAFDVVVSDERMPSMSGSQLLSIVRRDYPDVVRIILSGQASFESALRAINGAEIYRFLMKPCSAEEVGITIREALLAREERRRFAEWKSSQLDHEPRELSRSLEASLAGAWMAFQPIVIAQSMQAYGYEALLRSDDPQWHGPQSFFTLAAKLGRSNDVSRRVRELVAARAAQAPEGVRVFFNLCPEDLADQSLLADADVLAPQAARIVLEITERQSLTEIGDLDARVKRLRERGYHVAIDDIGAGFSGLTSLALLLPDIVKFDMDLVRDIHRSPTKQAIVGAMVQLCRKMRIQTLAEGVETREELDTVVALGCDLLQGYLLGRPSLEFA